MEGRHTQIFDMYYCPILHHSLRQYHFLELARRYAERLLPALYKDDIALGYPFLEVQDMNIFRTAYKLLRDKTYSEVGCDHRQDLIGGERLYIGVIRQSVAGKEC